MIIAVCNQKGGVSKTTTAFNTGAALAERGHNVCFWDTDTEQCDLHHLATSAGFSCFVPTPFNLSSQIANIQADFHLIDTPPRDDAAMRRALSIADFALVTVPVEYLTIRGWTRLYQSITASQTSNSTLILKSVVTMYSPNFRAEKDQLRSLKGFSFCNTVLPRNKVVSESPAHGLSVLEYAPRSQSARAYRSLAKEIEKWNQL